MHVPSAIRAAAIATVASILVGCSTEPPVSPGRTASAAPTGPAATPPSNPARLAAIQLPRLEEAPSRGLEYGPVLAAPGGFVVTGITGPDAPVIWFGDATATTWELHDATDMGGRIVDLAAGPAGWIAATRSEAGVTRLWTSTDRRRWLRYSEPDGVAQAHEIHVSASGQGFVVQVAGDGSPGVTYSSDDGRHWTPGSPIAPPDVGLVAAIRGGYLFAASGGSSGDPITVSVSSDGRSWSPVTLAGATAPTAVWYLQAAGPGVIAIGSTGDEGPARAWYGTLSGAGQQRTLTWAETTPDSGFGPVVFAAVALTDPFGELLGYDAASHAPVVWSATGSARWTRRDLPVAAFGYGVPSSLAVVGTTAMTLGWRVNDAGESVRQPWRSTDGGPWQAVDTDVFGVLPNAPTGPCPPVALDEVASYLAIPAILRPVCFGQRTLHLRGYAVDCGGCGGVDPTIRHPEWLQHALGIWPLYLQPTARAEGVWPDRLGVSIDPARPIRIPRVGAFVEVTGHFDDPAAMTCTAFPILGLGAGFEPQSIVVAGCRQEFVATGVKVLAN